MQRALVDADDQLVGQFVVVRHVGADRQHRAHVSSQQVLGHAAEQHFADRRATVGCNAQQRAGLTAYEIGKLIRRVVPVDDRGCHGTAMDQSSPLGEVGNVVLLESR